MKSINTEIYFVLDKNWKENLYTLSRERHIWICKSKLNDIQINKVWKKDNYNYKPNKGITSFKINDTIENTFYNFLGVIDDHHQDGNSNIQEWQKIVVFGTDFKQLRKSEIEEVLGFNISINVLEGYFEIVKEID